MSRVIFCSLWISVYECDWLLLLASEWTAVGVRERHGGVIKRLRSTKQAANLWVTSEERRLNTIGRKNPALLDVAKNSTVVYSEWALKRINQVKNQHLVCQNLWKQLSLNGTNETIQTTIILLSSYYMIPRHLKNILDNSFQNKMK